MTGIEKDLVASLEDFRDRLESGERITATTVQKCGCWRTPEVLNGQVYAGDPKCYICKGKGYTFDAITILPNVS